MLLQAADATEEPQPTPHSAGIPATPGTEYINAGLRAMQNPNYSQMNPNFSQPNFSQMNPNFRSPMTNVPYLSPMTTLPQARGSVARAVNAANAAFDSTGLTSQAEIMQYRNQLMMMATAGVSPERGLSPVAGGSVQRQFMFTPVQPQIAPASMARSPMGQAMSMARSPMAQADPEAFQTAVMMQQQMQLLQMAMMQAVGDQIGDDNGYADVQGGGVGESSSLAMRATDRDEELQYRLATRETSRSRRPKVE